MGGKHLLVSGFFGNSEIEIHNAARGTRSVFFTNNPKIAEYAKDKGWEPVVKDDNDFALTDDVRVSSIQSKYVKFLQFRREYQDLAQYRMVTYCDHRACIQDKELVELFTRMDWRKSILIRSSPRKKGLPREIEISRRQPRYEASMAATVEWIDAMRQRSDIQDDRQIANTGMIHTIRVNHMMPLFDAVYEAIVELKQPQCQIVWAVLSQRSASDIQQVSWNEIPISWGRSPIDRGAAVKVAG